MTCDRVKGDGRVCDEPVEWVVRYAPREHDIVCGACLLEVLDHEREQMVRHVRTLEGMRPL